MLVYSNDIVGNVIIKHNGYTSNLEMRLGNVLAVFISEGIDENGEIRKYLYTFFEDEKHLKNMKREGFKPFAGDEVKIRLNMKYKENYKVLKYLVEYYNIECYFE